MKATNHSFCLLLLPLLAVLMLTSCSRHSAVWPQLLEAEQLLETDLQSAGAMIDSLDATLLEGEDAALYAILKTQADWKRYHPLTSDSLPRLATDYYGTPYRKNYHAAMAWYSLGCYYTEQKDDAGAVEVYLRAKDLFPDTLSRYHALCYQNIGKHLNHHNMPQEAIPYLRIFRAHPACAVDSSLIANADHFLGLAFLYNSQFDQAEEAFYSVLRNPFAMENDVLDVVFQLSKLMYHDIDNYGASIAFVDKYLSECHSLQHVGALWLVKGDIFHHYNELDSALIYYKRALQDACDIYTRCNAYKQLLSLAPLMNENDSIPSYSAHYTSLLSTIFEESRSDEIYEAKAKHEAEMSVWRHHTISMALFIILLLVVTAVLILYFVAKRRKNRQPSMYVINVAKSKQELIDQCKSAFYHTPAYRFIPSDLHFEKSLSIADKDELEKALKKSFVPLEEIMFDECDNLTSDDILTCTYILLDLPTKEIVACSKYTDNSISSRKHRLRAKLTPEWCELIFGQDEKEE